MAPLTSQSAEAALDPTAAAQSTNLRETRDPVDSTAVAHHAAGEGPSGIGEGEIETAALASKSHTNFSLDGSSSDGVPAAKSEKGTEKAKKSWLRRIRVNPLKRSKKPPIPEQRVVSKEYGAPWYSILTFSWMSSIMTTGYQRPLELNDLWLINPNRSVGPLSEKLDTVFRGHVKAGRTRPLLRALYDTFRYEFLLGGACRMTADIFMVMSPFTLRYLIQFASDAYVHALNPAAPEPHIGRGIGLAIGITAMQICQSTATNQFIYRGMVVGGQTRATLIALIFDKSLKISGRAKAGGLAAQQSRQGAALLEKGTTDEKPATSGKVDPKVDSAGWSNGRVVNLMGTDTYRIDQASGMFHIIWTAPISLIITLVVLLINLTYSALAGFAMIVVFTPALTFAIKKLAVRRRRMNKITDERVSLTQEILNGVRFVKYFGWEESFLKRLQEMRKREISAVQLLLGIRNAITAVSMTLPTFASLLAFITYSKTQHILTPAPIFSSLALFNSMRMPLNLLPVVIAQVTDAWVSLQRIEDYLLAEETADQFDWALEGPDAAVVKNASFTWETVAGDEKDEDKIKAGRKEAKKLEKSGKGSARNSTNLENLERQALVQDDSQPDLPFALKDLNFSIKKGELIAVVGSVGCGKTSVLAALGGDMRMTAGEVQLGASRAFCPQSAWIQNDTVQENVVFGTKFDQVWYDRVIDACALRPDLDMLPAGDQTEIGERGITISGGQKQRMNIARAIYFNADMVLLDDPLSAVDAHVGRHLFDRAICGLLKDKTRILATHQLHVLNRCDRIMWLKEGRMVAFDTFDELMSHNPEFAEMIGSNAQEEAEELVRQKTNEGKGEGEDEVEEEVEGPKKKHVKGAALMQAEERNVRSVPWSVYAAYVRSSGSLLNAPFLIILLCVAQAANILTSQFLAWWVSDRFGLPSSTYIGIYVGLAIMQTILMFVFSIMLTILGTTASKVLMTKAMRRCLRAPMSFYDTTPLGRIINRFSKDVDVLDNNLTDALRMYMFTLAMTLSVFILIIVYFYFFAVALVPMAVMFVWSASYYRASAREVKRLESTERSMVFARFGEGLSGTASIKAYGLQSRFSSEIRKVLDNMDAAYFLTFANQRWLSVRLDAIGNTLVFVCALLVVTSRFTVNPSSGGLVLSYLLSIVQILQFMIRQLAEVENAMNATERLHHYGTELEEEAPEHLGDVPPSWPEHGRVSFRDVALRYRAGLPLVLHDLTLDVRAGERIGIVGRTGAGKSSIMSALFRLVELSGGQITIDGRDISKVGLHDLRSRLSIIPQDPTLFRGTVRSNLDPFDQRSDLEMWTALRQAFLVEAEAAATAAAAASKHSPKSSTGSVSPVNGADEKGGASVARAQQPQQTITLDSPVSEEGLNFSLGQRQLMALSRALVRRSRIVVLDEATSSVDMETDQKIQETMRRGFSGCTVLCIAHRLRTILGYDRIVVMDRGSIAEVGTPVELWRRGGIFRGMCERSGIGERDFVVEDGDGAGEEQQQQQQLVQ